MRLKLNYLEKKGGVLIFEIPPQTRTLPINRNKGFARLNFPYLIIVITYQRRGPKLLYQGIYGSGLRVYFKNSPLESLDDSVFYIPTDYFRLGIVCTDHRRDSSLYDTKEDLVKAIITLWYGTVHDFEYDIEWFERTKENILATEWMEAGSLREIINISTERCAFAKKWNIVFPPKDATIIDFQWPIKISDIIEDLIKEINDNKASQ